MSVAWNSKNKTLIVNVAILYDRRADKDFKHYTFYNFLLRLFTSVCSAHFIMIAFHCRARVVMK